MPGLASNPQFKLVTLAAILALSAVSCSSEKSGERRLIEVDPGELGTILAVGTEFSGKPKLITNVSVERGGEKSSEEKGPYDFTLLQSKTKGISIGTAALGPVPLLKNESSDAFIPASITKVITGALALKALGPDFRFTTEVRWKTEPGNDSVAQELMVIADGDPTINTRGATKLGAKARIVELVSQLKQRGIRKLTGKMILISDDERKDSAVAIDGIHPEDHTSCNGALAQAFNYRQNCAGLSITGVNRAKWGDSDLEFPIRTEMQSGQKTAVRTTAIFDRLSRIESFLIKGIWGVKKTKSIGVALPVPDVKPWFGNTLLREMERQGIDVSSVKPSLPTGADARQIAAALRADGSTAGFVLQSQPLSALVAYMNKPSNNFIADALFKAVAAKHRSNANDLRQAGIAALNENLSEWMKRAGHPEYVDEISLFDGAGLSRSNRTSPRAFLALLKEFSKESYFKDLWESLAIAGVDGTLTNRMRGTHAHGRVYAKTGTLRGAYQLAGYVPRLKKDGTIKEYVPFVILSAASESNRHRIRAFQDRLVARLTEVVNPSIASAPPPVVTKAQNPASAQEADDELGGDNENPEPESEG